MKITFSNIKQRWQVPCHGGFTAFVDGATDRADAEAALHTLNKTAFGSARRGMECLVAGEVVAAIYGPVVFLKS